jgi:hypothetical protein
MSSAGGFVMILGLTLGETILVELLKALFTALLVAGAAALIVRRYQDRAAAQQSELEHDRDLAAKDRDRERVDERARLEARAQFVSRTSELAGAFYFRTQQHWRSKQAPEVWGPPDVDELDAAYGDWASKSEVLENELRVRYGWEARPPQLWHQVRDLLTVRYFALRDQSTPGLRRVNARGYRDKLHSGLSAEELTDIELVLDTYQQAIRALAVELTNAEITV